MHVWNVLHAARWKCRTQKSAKIHYLGTIAQLCRAISLQLSHLSTIGKKTFKHQCLPHTHWRLTSVGEFEAPRRISTVFCVLAALLHGTRVEGVSRFAALNRWRHLHSAGRPSRWTLVHILVLVVLVLFSFLFFVFFLFFLFMLLLLLLLSLLFNCIQCCGRLVLRKHAHIITLYWQSILVSDADVYRWRQTRNSRLSNAESIQNRQGMETSHMFNFGALTTTPLHGSARNLAL